MEKLRELLNEFEIEKATRDYTRRIEKQNKIWICGTQHTGAYIDNEETERIIISKKYKFIERLIENDKIHCGKVIGEYGKTVGAKFISEPIQYNDFVSICLMLLSIQDEPVKYLISILN